MRCDAEKEVSDCAYFCGFSYSDDHLYCMKGDRFKSRYLFEQSQLPHSFRHYDYFLLNKSHGRLLRRRVRYWLKKFFGFTEPPRFVECGEYGDFHNRPHLHILYFLPWFVRMDLFEYILRLSWPYGDIEIGEVNSARINYVGKHCCKSCQGSDYQQMFSPSYMIQSTYPYGIGGCLQYDTQIIHYYNIGQKFIPYKGFKYSFPRFLRKKFHPDKLTLDEWEQLEHDSRQNFEKNIALSDISSELLLNLADDDLDDFYSKYRSYLMKQDFEKRKNYEMLRIQKKLKNKSNLIS